MSCISGLQSHHLFRNNYAMMKIFDQEFALELYLNEIRTEAKTEGFAEGFAKGFAEGFAEGIAKTKTEGELKKAQEMAFLMREKGFHDDIIAEILKVGVDVVHQWSTEPSPLL